MGRTLGKIKRLWEETVMFFDICNVRFPSAETRCFGEKLSVWHGGDPWYSQVLQELKVNVNAVIERAKNVRRLKNEQENRLG